MIDNLICYNERRNENKSIGALTFLKTKYGERIPKIVSTIVTQDSATTRHFLGFCDVTFRVHCFGDDSCTLSVESGQNQIITPSGYVLPVQILQITFSDFGPTVECRCEALVE